MKRLIACCIFGSAAATCVAQTYDQQFWSESRKSVLTARGLVPADEIATRAGPAIAWERFRFGQGALLNLPAGSTFVDWGDVPTGTVINGISTSVVMWSGIPADNSFVFALYQNDNGGALGAADPNDPATDPNLPANNRQVLGIWTLLNVQIPLGQEAHQELLIDLEDPNLGPPITITGGDLDGDGLSDFGYSVSILERPTARLPQDTRTFGPFVGPSNFGVGPTGTSPGATPAASLFNFNVADPNEIVVPPQLAQFQFTANMPAPGQFAWRLWTDGECLDADGDGICNAQDVCPDTPDPNQEDSDNDTHGDACDLCPGQPLGDNEDDDADGRGNPCDNCPQSFNPNQADCDSDGIGDVCDSEPGPGCVTGCPNAGCDDGGVDADFNNDCNVNLTDLATLLANFGTGSGATNASGDTDANGDIVLTDLANTLARFGNDCDGG